MTLMIIGLYNVTVKSSLFDSLLFLFVLVIVFHGALPALPMRMHFESNLNLFRHKYKLVQLLFE